MFSSFAGKEFEEPPDWPNEEWLAAVSVSAGIADPATEQVRTASAKSSAVRIPGPRRLAKIIIYSLLAEIHRAGQIQFARSAGIGSA
jgi:hypothetical protein